MICFKILHTFTQYYANQWYDCSSCEDFIRRFEYNIVQQTIRISRLIPINFNVNSIKSFKCKVKQFSIIFFKTDINQWYDCFSELILIWYDFELMSGFFNQIYLNHILISIILFHLFQTHFIISFISSLLILWKQTSNKFKNNNWINNQYFLLNYEYIPKVIDCLQLISNLQIDKLSITSK